MRQLLPLMKPEVAAVRSHQSTETRTISGQMKAPPSQPIQAKPMFQGLSQELSQAFHLSTQSEGKKLPEAVQQKMEAALNANFSDVRIHEGKEAREMGAIAYTQGSHIHFAPSRYDPLSPIGQSLLGHELAHVLQQRQGIVKPMLEIQGRAINNDPALEHEADVLGQKAATLSISEQSPLSRPSVAVAQTSSVIQCVGGVKFGIKPNETLANLRSTEGYKALETIVNQYDNEIKKKKQTAKDAFKGKEDNKQAQDQYSEALFQAERDIEELRKRINASKAVSLDKDQTTILDKNKDKIAELVEGSNAYTLVSEVGKDTAEPGQVQNIYKKYKLQGVSKTEYIESGSRKLRRYAYRGITPDEKGQIRKKGMVKPYYSTDESRKQNQTGVHYPKNEPSYPRASTKVSKSRKVVNTGDLDFLHDVSGVSKKLKEVPLASRPFLQERKGVNKEFSATATNKEITSNHGSGFGTFGSVTLDLAKVDPSDILHHYANTGEARMASGVPKEFVTDEKAMAQEEKRAGLTAIRNREVHLNQYPASAIVGNIQDSQGVKDYKDEYDKAYQNKYDVKFAKGYAIGYSQGRKSKTAAGSLYKNPDTDFSPDYNYTYQYRDNGVGVAAGKQDGLKDGDAHGFEDGQKQGRSDGEADFIAHQEEIKKSKAKTYSHATGGWKKKY